jgi:fatty-acyl-CoA synthase
MACLDEDGYIRITDRIKDVIKIGGEWISSLELEKILLHHEAVKEVAVVGVPDPKWDERPLAFIVLRDGHQDQVSARDLAHYLHRFIDAGSVHQRAILTRFRFVPTLPRTSVGKFDKKTLRAQARALAQTHGAEPVADPRPTQPPQNR